MKNWILVEMIGTFGLGMGEIVLGLFAFISFLVILYFLFRKTKSTTEPKISVNNFSQNNINITEAELIDLAIQAKGRLSVALLCHKKSITLTAAQNLLDNLHEKGAFEVKVNEDGLVEYWLIDKSLYLPL